jgi:hypothetical protein
MLIHFTFPASWEVGITDPTSQKGELKRLHPKSYSPSGGQSTHGNSNTPVLFVSSLLEEKKK